MVFPISVFLSILAWCLSQPLANHIVSQKWIYNCIFTVYSTPCWCQDDMNQIYSNAGLCKWVSQTARDVRLFSYQIKIDGVFYLLKMHLLNATISNETEASAALLREYHTIIENNEQGDFAGQKYKPSCFVINQHTVLCKCTKVSPCSAQTFLSPKFTTWLFSSCSLVLYRTASLSWKCDSRCMIRLNDLLKVTVMVSLSTFLLKT